MECPRDLVEMNNVVGKDESPLSLCDTCGGVWLDSADLNRLLLRNNLPGLESMGGKVNIDELSERCAKDQVDLVVVDGGDKANPRSYAYCEACGGIWLDIEVPEGLEPDALEDEIIEFFKVFSRAGTLSRSARL